MPLMVSVCITPWFLAPVAAQKQSTIFLDSVWLALITLFPRYGLLLDGAIVSAPATDVLSDPLAWMRTRISAP